MVYRKELATNYVSCPDDLNDLFVAKYLNAAGGEFNDEFDWRSGMNERRMRYADVLQIYGLCLLLKVY